MMDTRSITEADIPLLAKWNIQLHEDEKSVVMTKEAATERYSRWLQTGLFDGTIFSVNAKPIGYIIYQSREAHVDLRANTAVYVRQFFIARESRRKQYGTQAFNFFLNKLVAPDVNVILNVKSSNPAGQMFWESLGFTPENIEYELLRNFTNT